MAIKFPPHSLLVRSGSPDRQSYSAVGLEFLSLLQELGHLQTSSHVLELGCGTGRIGQYIIPCLEAPGQYWGQDVDLEALEWFRGVCPGIETTLGHYEAAGCPDGWASLVLAASVYTHKDEKQVRKSLTSVFSKLAPGGTLLATFFILPQDYEAQVEGHSGDFQFVRGSGNTRRARFDPTNVAFTESCVGAIFRDLGFETRFLPGWWSGNRISGNTFQDLVVARKG